MAATRPSPGTKNPLRVVLATTHIPLREVPSRLTSASIESAARTTRDGEQRSDHGVIAPVRTYESPIDRRLEEVGFETISTVTLLMKETLVRVAEPALVPAGIR